MGTPTSFHDVLHWLHPILMHPHDRQASLACLHRAPLLRWCLLRIDQCSEYPPALSPPRLLNSICYSLQPVMVYLAYAASSSNGVIVRTLTALGRSVLSNDHSLGHITRVWGFQHGIQSVSIHRSYRSGSSARSSWYPYRLQDPNRLNLRTCTVLYTAGLCLHGRFSSSVLRLISVGTQLTRILGCYRSTQDPRKMAEEKARQEARNKAKEDRQIAGTSDNIVVSH